MVVSEEEVDSLDLDFREIQKATVCCWHSLFS